jgi:DNA invertase Pin-like site-specific DNA recombinase
MNNPGTQPATAVAFLRARYLGSDHAHDRSLEERMIDAQRQTCQQLADRLDATIIREYVEFGGTGSIDKRPQLRLMLDELRALHDATYVITENPDRISRRVADWNAVHLELEASGAKLVTAAGDTAIYQL